MVWGYLGLNDRVNVTKRGSKGTGTVVEMDIANSSATVEMDDGREVTVNIADTTKTRKARK